jgi:flavin reductase (DIM6/NTAB) family NADH-FMN oxidoreductase RutF
MKKKSVLEILSGEKHFFYYPAHVAIVGVTYNKKTNFMPCAWNTGLSYDPFLYGVSVGTDRATASLISSSRQFSINFVDFSKHPMVRALGRSSGAEIDKAKKFDVKFYEGAQLDCPIMEDAYLSYECNLFEKISLGDHILFVGKASQLHISEEIENQHIVETDTTKPLLYLGMDHYLTVDSKTLKSLKELPFHYKK